MAAFGSERKAKPFCTKAVAPPHYFWVNLGDAARPAKITFLLRADVDPEDISQTTPNRFIFDKMMKLMKTQ